MKLLRSCFLGVLLFTLASGLAYAQTITPKVSVNYGNSYVLTEKGEVYSFGHNEWGELGQGNINRNDIPGALDLSNMGGKKIWKLGEGISTTHQLLIAEDSTLYGYGENIYYQMGSSYSPSNDHIPSPVNSTALAGRKIVQAVQNDNSSYVLTDSGYVYTAGSNNNGYLGLGTTADPIQNFTRIDTAAFNGEKIVKISSGKTHRLFLSENGTVFAVGENVNGQLSTGNTYGQTVPVPINTSTLGGKTVIDIATSQGASMVLTQDGSVFTCGNYRNEGLGQGNITQDVHLFTEVDQTHISGKKMIQIAMKDGSGYMLSSDGTLYGMGGTGFIKQNGSDIASNIPIEITNSTFVDGTISEFHVGGIPSTADQDHILLKTSTGTWYALGHSTRGQTGTGYTTYLETPKPVNLSEVQGDSLVQVEGGNYKTFFLDNDGIAYSTGYRAPLYESGSDAEPSRLNGRTLIQGVATPQKMDLSNLAGKTVIDVVAGPKQAFLLTKDGEVYGTGRAAGGHLGTTDSVDVYIPEKIDYSNIGGKKIIKIASGGTNDDQSPQGHTLLLAEDGTVFSFGDNAYGQLGLGDRVNRNIPTPLTDPVIASKKIVDIAANGRNSLFIAEDGTVLLCGIGGNGEMGFGDTNDRLVPTVLNTGDLSGVKIVEGVIGTTGNSTTYSHFLLRSSDNRLFSFGEGSDGQLAQGSKTNNYVPTEIAASSYDNKTPVGIAAGYHTDMVRMADGSLYSAGNVNRVGFDTFTFTDYSSLTRVEGDLKNRFVTDMATFDEFSIAALDDGTVLTFGDYNKTQFYYGNLGNGEPKPSNQNVPTEVKNLNVLKSPIPTTNLALHLDAGRGLTQSGDSVTTWADLGSLGNDGTQATLAQRPVLIDSAINNRRAIRFNGTDSYLTLPTAATLGIQNSDYEMFVVAKSATVNSNVNFLVAGGAEQYELHLNGSSGARFIPNTGNYIDVGTTGEFSDTTAQLFNVRATDTQGILSVNGNETVDAGNAQSADNSTLRLGVRSGDGYWFKGDIAEVIMYSGVLSDPDRKKVEDYLYKKYQIQNYKASSGQLTGTEGWRLLSSPVIDSTYATLLSSLWTQGFTGANIETGTPNVYSWPTASTNPDATNWTAIANIDDPLPPGKGMLVYVFSDDNGPDVAGDAGFPKTLSLEGREPDTDQDLTSLLNANVNGWALVGNPYRKDIDWDAFTKSGLSGSVYVYDANAASWKTWNGTSGGLTGGQIGAFNAFFVQTMSKDPTLTIPTSAKSDSANSFLGKEMPNDKPISFSLDLQSNDGLKNSAWFQFSKEASTGLDKKDAHQLSPLSSSYVLLASKTAASSLLDINNRPYPEKKITIPLYFESTESGKFTLSLNKANVTDGWDIRILDHSSGNLSSLDHSFSFDYQSPKNKRTDVNPQTLVNPVLKAKSTASERFSLVINPTTNSANKPGSDLPKKVALNQNYPNPFNPTTVIRYAVPAKAQVKLSIYNVLGQRVQTLINAQKSPGRYQVSFDGSHLASGLYFYKLKVGAKIITKKMTLIK